ncbi:MAG: MoaD/ThiS family protein [Betaproteobacteria bacterium]|nr:MoaD/ThiS family protein [Betaproteobacteria bacterium]
MRVTLKLYATLTDYLPAAARAGNLVQLDVDEGATISSMLAPYNIPPRLVHLVLVNGVFVPPEERAARTFREGEVLAVWPPIAGG